MCEGVQSFFARRRKIQRNSTEERQMKSPVLKDVSAKRPALTDIKTLRERARQHIDKGAVTSGYAADREAVITMLNEALATELVCVLRYNCLLYTSDAADERSS